MRAREPDESGYVVSARQRIYYEVHGTGAPTVLLMPTWSIVHSRMWKMQVPYLARHFRVVTFDGRGNGRSDRPRDAAAYADSEFVADAVAVLDGTQSGSAVVVGLSMGAGYTLRLAAEHPDRVLGCVFIAPALGLSEQRPERRRHPFWDPLPTDSGWAKYNAHYWRRDWAGFAAFFMSQMFNEAHSTKQIDDAVGWALETDPETILQVERAEYLSDDKVAHGGPDRAAVVGALAARVRCPCLVVHGSDDAIAPVTDGERLAELLGCKLSVFEGSGHGPTARDPVRFNLLLRDFVDSIAPRRSPRSAWTRASRRRRRALWISSPIGLGHILRDLAVARELRTLVPDLEIHWWAQSPVTDVLEREREFVHPASHELASESAHWETEAADHDLHAFYAFRNMDEILCANYLLFDDVVHDTHYDAWIGDESWEVDYYLHENPERKIAPYAFLTDVVGFLPVDPDRDLREAELTADYNAEMIEQRARFPQLRDASLYIGSHRELPNASFGPGLPRIREWTREWFESVPYVVPFDPAAYADKAVLRTRLGYTSGDPLLVASVGGTSVGRDLLELTAEAFDLLRRRLPEARLVMVTGPRIDPKELPDVEGMEKRPYVHDLFEHLACADAAIVQGGLSTTMELTALRRPFVYFPLHRHWEQQHHVAARLDHYRAGLRLNYASTSPRQLAAAVQRALAMAPRYRQVRSDGAFLAARRIAPLLAR